MAFALTRLLLQLERDEQPVMWYGELRNVPLPAAVACNSPWLDIAQSTHGWDLATPAHFDYLPKPEQSSWSDAPACGIWPAEPPREHIYVDDDLAAHPLASIVMPGSWKGAPPMYMCTGWEILAYEDKYLAKRLVEDGVTVVFEEYEAMPHCFALILSKIPGAVRCLQGWAQFILDAVDQPASIPSRAILIKSISLEESELKFEELSAVTEDEMMIQAQRKVVRDGEPDAKL